MGILEGIFGYCQLIKKILNDYIIFFCKGRFYMIVNTRIDDSDSGSS
jgi:hypothetical protein